MLGVLQYCFVDMNKQHGRLQLYIRYMDRRVMVSMGFCQVVEVPVALYTRNRIENKKKKVQSK